MNFPKSRRTPQASPDGAAPGAVDDDWRRFRARLLRREDALTEDVAEGTMEVVGTVVLKGHSTSFKQITRSYLGGGPLPIPSWVYLVKGGSW